MSGGGWHTMDTIPEDTDGPFDLWIGGNRHVNCFRTIYLGNLAWRNEDNVLVAAERVGVVPSHWRWPPVDPNLERQPLTAAQAAEKSRIEALARPDGSYSREALASLGVKWPPVAGWKMALIRRAK